VRLRTVDGPEHLVRAALRGLHARLDPARFVQVHRSVVINVEHVAAIDRRSARGWEILMRDGRRIPVGRNYESAAHRLRKP
jgi:two-component system LytT family response regulator